MINQIYKNLIYFVIGGAMIVAINNLAVSVNSTAAALLWSFPILSIPAFIFIYFESNDRKLLMDLNSDIIIFFFVNLTFFGFIYCLVQYTNYNIPQILGIATGLYLIIAIITYFVVRNITYLH